MFRLDGQLALVTGGSRGLGLAMARALGHAGARVAITARKDAELVEAERSLRAEGIFTVALRHDLGDAPSSADLIRRIRGEVGDVDVLVNNAGATWGAPAESYPLDAWHKVTNVNLHGTWALTQAVATQCMIPRRRGVIVIVASVAGTGGNRAGDAPTVAYNVTKAAQINLARALACEWGPLGLRVNALLPGWFPTRMTAGTLADHGTKLVEATPLGRLGDTERDIAGPIVFLCSDASRYVTGTTLTVDGGFSAPA